METPIAYRVVELVRAHIGTAYVQATDTDVARALGLSRNAISEYKKGRSKMAPATVARAIELLAGSAHEATPLLQELMTEQAHSEPEGAVWRLFMQIAESAKGKAAALALVAAVVTAGTLYAPESNQAVAASFDAPAIYIIRTQYLSRGLSFQARQLAAFPEQPGAPPLLQSISKPADSSAFV